MELDAATQTLLDVFEIVAGPGRAPPGRGDLPVAATDEAQASNRMESFWIKALHNAFLKVFAEGAETGVVVLSKAKKDEIWHRSEFLHDVTVLTRRKVLSPYRKVRIPVADKILWQVESELSGSGREVAIDMSKLVAGAAASKLMVVRLPVERQKDGLEVVKNFVEDIGKGCMGQLFLAFVPYYSIKHRHLKAYWLKDEPLPMALFGQREGLKMERVALPWLPREIVL